MGMSRCDSSSMLNDAAARSGRQRAWSLWKAKELGLFLVSRDAL